MIGQQRILQGRTPDASQPFQAASIHHFEAAKNCPNPSHVVHIAFQGAGLEAFSRFPITVKQPTRCRQRNQNSRTTVYNIAVYFYDISHHS